MAHSCYSVARGTLKWDRITGTSVRRPKSSSSSNGETRGQCGLGEETSKQEVDCTNKVTVSKGILIEGLDLKMSLTMSSDSTRRLDGSSWVLEKHHFESNPICRFRERLRHVTTVLRWAWISELRNTDVTVLSSLWERYGPSNVIISSNPML